MKRFFLILLIALTLNSYANLESDSTYVFDTLCVVKTTPVKDQSRSGTCWSFAATSFIETELLRKGKPALDLSEMYFVREAYPKKALNYVQMHGLTNFGEGGQAHDVIDVVKERGMLLEKDYQGLYEGQDGHNHAELAALLKAQLNVIVKNKSRKINPAWKELIKATLDLYLGKVPQTFSYEKAEYTPLEFVKEVDFNPNDYVEITSYTHHPFYEAFRLEVPDNWSNSDYYNVPQDELIQIMKYALENGYSICWDGDVSERGFSHNNALAIVPEAELQDQSGTEKDRWSDLSKAEKMNRLYSFDKPVKEKEITPQDRQATFENYTSTDDHLMHITGMLKDQHGTVYFITKNSWRADSNDDGGYLNMSESYVKLKTVAIMVHKDAIPQSIRRKLGL